MELAYYSDYAVRLVNSEEPARGTDTLTSVEAVRDLFGASTPAARRATDADVTRFRSRPGPAARGLRGGRRRRRDPRRGPAELAAAGVPGQPADLRPRLPGRRRPPAAGTCTSPTTRRTRPRATRRSPAMGLAFHLTEYGVDRLGLCQARAVPQRLPRHLDQPLPALLLRPLRDPRQRGRLPRPQAPGDRAVGEHGPHAPTPPSETAPRTATADPAARGR